MVSFPDHMSSLYYFLSWSSIFFFFQAEDGIRFGHVTGVQTCALPISATAVTSNGATSSAGSRSPTGSGLSRNSRNATPRSEERRVGKECRSLGARKTTEKDIGASILNRTACYHSHADEQSAESRH